MQCDVHQVAFLFSEVKTMAIALGFSRELATLAGLMMRGKQTLGLVGEQYARIMLEAHGYLVDVNKDRLCGDLRVVCPSGQVLRVEVKSTKLNKDGRFQFCITRRTKSGYIKTSCANCDAVMLLGVTASGRVEIYIIPSQVIANYSIVKFSPKLSANHKWKQYRQYPGSLSFKAIEDLSREVLAS